MKAISGVKIVKTTAPILAAIILSGCVSTYDDGYYPAQPGLYNDGGYGQYANFGDYGGPIFGYQGDIRFIADSRFRYRIMGRGGDFLGFAYIEHDYRVRIVDPYGTTLYWYYLRPNGNYHILDASYGYLGILTPRHRQFANFNRFSRPRMRHFRRHEIDNDRHDIRREVRDRREHRDDRDRGRGRRARDDGRADRDRDHGRDSADRGRDRAGDDVVRGRDRNRADRRRDRTRSAPAASRRPAEVRNARQPVVIDEPDVWQPDGQVAEPARRNTRRVRNNDRRKPQARQRANQAPAAVAPNPRRNAAPATVDRRQNRGRPQISADPQRRREPAARPSRPAGVQSAQPRRTPQAAQPRRAAPARQRPAAVAPARPSSRPANTGKAREQAIKRAKAQAKAKAKDKDKNRRRRGSADKDDFKTEEDF